MNSPTLYTIRLERQAERELRKLPRDVVQRINAALERLIHEPRPQGVVKLTGQTGSKWRIRVGAYRILYEINDQHAHVNVYRIKHRRNAYDR